MAYTTNIIPVMTSDTAPSGVASAQYEEILPAFLAFNHTVGTGDSDRWVTQHTAAWLQYQFATAKTIVKYALTSQGWISDGPWSPKSWTFEGSNDGSTWDTLDTQTNVTSWAAQYAQTLTFTFANTTAYTHYRLDVTQANTGSPSGYLSIGEMEMMETAVVPEDATGGDIIAWDGPYCIHVFTGDGTLSVAAGWTIDAEVLVVGGAGGGCYGAGGAGGFLTGAETLTGTMSVIVGSGGEHGHPNPVVAPTAGGDSTFGSRTAYGGGRGGYPGGSAQYNGGVGASGGGGVGNAPSAGGSASPPGQGYAGGSVGSVAAPYHAGGGGGAGAGGGWGGSAGNGVGGAGLNSDILENGVNVGYAGGGGGGCGSGGTAGTASHGGGVGAVANGTAGSGAANTGSGGGGTYINGTGGDGAAGIVIIRYLAGARRLEAHGGISLDGVAGLFLWGLARLDATGGITLPGTATLWSMFSSIDMTPSGTISLSGAAALSNDSRLVGSASIALGGDAWLSAVIHGDDTMEARGFIHTGSRARLNTGEVWPATDDDGWTTPDVTTPDLRGLVVKVGGLSVKRAQMTDLVIELDIEGGPLSATLSVNCELSRAPKLMQTLEVTYKGQTLFPKKGRLEHIASNVDSSTGYTLTYAGPLVTLRDHKAFRCVYVDSDLQSWSTDQGPRTSPDTFEVASRSSGATV